jgi:dUTP pyrophosphatase
MEKIYFAKLKPSARIPSKRDEDAGYDIYALIDEPYWIIKPHETRLIPTGIASACSEDYYFQVHERGSTGTKGIAQRCGVIDSGYRGEWFLPITNLNTVPLCLKSPDAVLPNEITDGEYIVYDLKKALAQAVLLPVPKTEVCELSYDELCQIQSERMAGRLGSSQK